MPLEPYADEGIGDAYLASVTAKGKEFSIPEPKVKGNGTDLFLNIAQHPSPNLTTTLSQSATPFG